MDVQLTETREPSLNPERQEKAKEYARIRRRLMLVDLALGGVYALAWLLSGASVWLRDQIMDLTQQPLLVVALYVLVFGGVYALLDAPLSYYRGFVLPHRYSLSTQPLRAWLWDQVKGAAIGEVLGLIVIQRDTSNFISSCAPYLEPPPLTRLEMHDGEGSGCARRSRTRRPLPHFLAAAALPRRPLSARRLCHSSSGVGRPR
jgi:hypothetical protein